MDESHGFEIWIHDARERGLPVAVTGVVLFGVEFGTPFWAVALVLSLLMLTVLLIAARVEFGPQEAEDPGW